MHYDVKNVYAFECAHMSMYRCPYIHMFFRVMFTLYKNGKPLELQIQRHSLCLYVVNITVKTRLEYVKSAFSWKAMVRGKKHLTNGMRRKNEGGFLQCGGTKD